MDLIQFQIFLHAKFNLLCVERTKIILKREVFLGVLHVDILPI